MSILLCIMRYLPVIMARCAAFALLFILFTNNGYAATEKIDYVNIKIIKSSVDYSNKYIKAYGKYRIDDESNDQSYIEDFKVSLRKKLEKKFSNVNEQNKNDDPPNTISIHINSLSLERSEGTSNCHTNVKSSLSIDLNNTNIRFSKETTGESKLNLAEQFGGLVVGLATLGGSLAAQGAIMLKMSTSRAIDQITIDIVEEITNNYKLANAIREVREFKSLPSNIVMTADYSDTHGFIPNKIIDAGESCELVVTTTNSGQGTAYGSVLEIASDNSKIAINKTVQVGDITPGETKELRIPIKAGLDLGDGQATFQLSLKEKRGYDSKKVILNIPTAKLEKPNLVVVSTEINDGDAGLAKGNGNGVIESGETIELTTFIKNEGVGKALGVSLSGNNITDGVLWARESTLVGTIQPGETAKAKLAFTVPRNFAAKEIGADLKVADTRGVSDAQKHIAYAYSQRSPNLQYAWKILHHGSLVSSITNGSDYDIELTLSNTGQIPANDVIIRLSTLGGLILSRSSIDVGTVKEGAILTSQRFTLSVPRTFVENKVPLQIQINQADFSSAQTSLTIPVEVKGPRVQYAANLLSKHNGNILEQGEQAILELQVVNEGNLAAEGVHVKIDSRDENLKIIGKAEAMIGKVLPLTQSETVKFQISTMRRIKIGDAIIGVNITQNDFSPIVTQYALNIREEGATVIDVASEERGRKPLSTQTKQGPALIIKSPQTLDSTTEETVRLAFDVSDSRNIEKVRVEMNGLRMDLTDRDGMTPTVSKNKQIIKNIRLQEGENRIVIVAYNADNISAQKEIIIRRIGEEDVDTPLVTGMNNPKGVAVVIGISKYENHNIPPVDYAKRDAMKVRDYLIRTMGFKESNILELYDEKATVSKVKNTLNRELKKRVDANSDVFVYFNGHGLPETNANEPFFTTYDVDAENPGDTAYSMKELYRQLQTLKARNVIVVIDACFSGMTDSGAKKITPLIKSASPVFMEVSNPLLKMQNSVVFTSSKGKQISSWYHQKQHGLFTYYFLQGLRGKAALDSSGVITARGMEQYLDQQVPVEAMKLYSREQTPEVVGNKDLVLVKYK